MNAYLPHDACTIESTAAVLAGTLVAGFAITRLHQPRLARTTAWLLTAGSVVGVERFCAEEPPGVRMLAIIVALMFGMKTVVTVESQADGGPRLAAWRWFTFAAGWPGMRPALFGRLGGKPQPDAARLVASGALRLLVGATMVGAAWLVGTLAGWRIPATALLLVGLSLMTHFGIFNILAATWRRAGVDCRPLFRAPLQSRSLTEFWGRRWNLAFSEMTAVAVYRPLEHGVGKSAAMAGAFLFSGLLHELAISVPVETGYGLPSLYFALHGGVVLLERRLEGTAGALPCWGWLGRAWTFGWLVLPLPILFHPAFLTDVVWPLIGMSN
jgi:Membrane bound O-acyl transferase family